MNQPPRGRGRGRGRGGPGSDVSSTSSRGGPAGGRGGGPPGGFRGGPGGRGGGGPPGGFRPRGGPPPTVFAAGTPATPGSHLTDLDNLVNSFRNLQVTPGSPLRPGYGTAGRPISLRANFFSLRLPKKMLLYDYEVKITPDDVRGPRKTRIFELLEGSPECAPYASFIAHDSSQRIVSTRQLPQPLQVTITYTDPGQTQPATGIPVYTVKVNFVRALNLDDMMSHLGGQQRDFDNGPFVSAMNLILQKQITGVITQSNAVKLGQNKYFNLAQPSFPLSLGLEARRGYFMSVRPMYKQLMVNVNVCMAAFYTPGNMADAMFEFERQTGGMPSQFVQRLKVVTSHLGYPRKRAILRIMGTNPRQQSFPCAELGGTVTVEQYFQRKYNIRLRYADKLPVIDVGTKDKPNYLPPEICNIFPGQPYRGELPPDATRSMIEVACNQPAENANWIVNEGLPFLGLKTNTATLGSFGVTVSPDMAVVPARILPPPQVTYASGRPPNVKDASWNILDVKFHKGGNMTNWAVLLVQDGGRGEFSGVDDQQLRSFLQTFMAKCRSSGLTVANGPPTIMATPRLPRPNQDQGRRRALDSIRQTIVGKLNPAQKPSFILVLLSGEDKYIYPGIKRLCDMTMGLQTVFMLLLPKKAGVQDPRKLDQYFSNVCLKVNAKLGGINHLLRDDPTMRWLKSKKTMLMGVDVTHPSPLSTKGTPSIVAVVASVDDDFVQYPASLGLQRNRNISRDSEEMVQELTSMVVERLISYEKKSKKLPERLIVFRDGVSEGQYNLVIDKELPRILDAFKKFDTKARGGKYRPELSIIVCGKRHHARFPATATDHMVANNGNTVPGTVVDKGVTAIYNHDFYLQAHNGLKGTVKPTHYYVVYDEIKIPADTLQGLTHNLSYLYTRATKGVSLVPPAYYADIACERARLYLSQLMDSGDARSVTSRGSGGERERQAAYDKAVQQWGSGVHVDLKESMFYV